MSRTVVYGQDPPLDLEFVLYRGAFWKADLNWQNADASPVSAVGRSMSLEWERTALGSVVYPPDLESDEDVVPPLDTANYLQLSDGRIEIGLTSETTAGLTFSSTVFRIFLLTDGVPELWAKGRARLVV